MGQFIWIFFVLFFGVLGEGFGYCLILVPYKYSVGGRRGLFQTVLSWPVGKGSQDFVYTRLVRASGCG